MEHHPAPWALSLGSILVCAVIWTSPARAFVWPNVPEQIARGLASSNVTERRTAAQRLTELPPELASTLVTKSIADPDPDVRLRVAEAAIALRLPAISDLVIPWLSESDARIRLAACEVIRSAPSERAVIALGRVLGDPDAHVRRASAAAMGNSGLPAAVSPLLGHLDDPALEVRAEIARALGRIGDAKAVVPLLGKVQDSTPEVRKAVARALGDLGDARAAGPLMLAIEDGSEDVRIEALGSLGRLRADEATLAIAPLVERGGTDFEATTPPRGASPSAPQASGGYEVRAAALRALGKIGSDQAVRVLIGALAKDDPAAPTSPVREALVSAGNNAVGPLVALLSGSPTRASAAGGALVLGELRAPSASAAIVRAMQRGVLPLRYGLRALGTAGAPSALPTVLELIDDADPSTRREAIRSATLLLSPKEPDGRAVDPATEALGAPGATLEEKIDLVRLLGKTGAPSAQRVLLSLVTTKTVPLRLAVIEALGTLGVTSPAVDDALVRALSDEAAEVRVRAAASLSEVAGPETAKKLLDKLSLAAEQDRGAIGIALSGALSRVREPAVAEKVANVLGAAPDVARDALIEGLGRMQGAAALSILARLGNGSIDDRRKAAEAMGGHPENVDSLLRWLTDPDPGVRANAVWSLGAAGKKEHARWLSPVLRDPDVAVAANAAAALGRMGAREGADVRGPLCAALRETRSYVRANALAGLAVAGVRCDGAVVRDLLAHDPSDVVRTAAANLLWWGLARSPAEAALADRRSLARCSLEDKSGAVASRCTEALTMGKGVEDVAVFVVSESGNAPSPRAPFALVRSDGLLRLGTSDRRGEIFEFDVPAGTIRLEVPAALSR